MQIREYSVAREVIQTGDVVFFQGSWHRPIQALIMLATSSRFVHCGIALWVDIEGHRRLMCLEAQGGTTRRIVSMSFYDDRQMVVVAAPMPWSGVQEDALEKVGKVSYGWLTALYVGVREFSLKYLNVKLPRFQLSNEICSQFCATTYGLSNTEISPQVLYEQLLRISHER